MEIEIEIRVMLWTTRFPKARPDQATRSTIWRAWTARNCFQIPLEKVRYISFPENFCLCYQIWPTKNATNKDWKILLEVFEFSELSECSFRTDSPTGND